MAYTYAARWDGRDGHPVETDIFCALGAAIQRARELELSARPRVVEYWCQDGRAEEKREIDVGIMFGIPSGSARG